MHVVRPLGKIQTFMICHSTSNAYAARVAQNLAYLRLSVRFVVARCRDVPVLRSYYLCRLQLPTELQHVPMACTLYISCTSSPDVQLSASLLETNFGKEVTKQIFLSAERLVN